MALREIVAQFATKSDLSDLKKTDQQVDKTIDGFKRLAVVAAAAFAVNEIRQFIEETITLGDELDKTSRVFGITADQLQRFRFAGEIGGVGAAQMNTALRQLQRNALDAERGLSTQVEAFERLNVEFKNSDGSLKTLNELLPDVADGFSNLENPTERVALAQQLMGRSGSLLLTTFEDGAEGIKALGEEFEALGGGISQDVVEATAEAKDEMARLDVAMRSLRSNVTTFLVPAFNWLTRVTRNFVQAVNRLGDRLGVFEIFQKLLIGVGIIAAGVGAIMLVAWSPILGVIALITAGIAAWILVLDDFFVFLDGGKSVFGEFLDEIGVDSQAVADAINTMWGDIVGFWTEGDNQIRQLWISLKDFVSMQIEAIVDFARDKFGGILKTAGTIGGFLGGAADTVSGLLGGGAAVPSIPAPAGGTSSSTSVRSGDVTIQVSGAGNPESVGRAAARTARTTQGKRLRADLAAVQQRAGT